MTYIATEESVQDGSPVLLYEFLQGDTTWRFCSIGATISRRGSLWDPLAISPGKFVASTTEARASMSLEIPRTCALAMSLRGLVRDSETTITIFRSHYQDGDEESSTYWSGVVVTSTVNGNITVLECETLLASLGRKGPSRMYSRNCPYALGSAGKCNVDLEDYATEATATVVAGAVVTVPDAAAMDDLTWGQLKASDGSSRLIVSHSGSTIELQWPLRSLVEEFTGSPGGVTVTLYPGCKKTLDDCRERYGDAGCYGGQIGIPRKNPMKASLPVLE